MSITRVHVQTHTRNYMYKQRHTDEHIYTDTYIQRYIYAHIHIPLSCLAGVKFGKNLRDMPSKTLLVIISLMATKVFSPTTLHLAICEIFPL